MTADVVIVGAGPAGLAAAWELRLRGVKKVVVFERETAPGGTPRLCQHSPFGLIEFGRIMSGPSYAQRLVDRAVQSGVSVLTRHSVVDAGASGRLRIATPDAIVDVQASRVVIATGTRESSRAARFIPGDRPLLGCLTTGALQSILHEAEAVPFHRPVIVGTEFVSLSAIWTCRGVGMRPAAVVDDEPRPTAGTPFRILTRLLRIPVFLGAKIADVRGTRSVELVSVRLSNGKTIDIPCDGLLCTGRFVPESAILQGREFAVDPETRRPLTDRFGRCSEDYYAIGNVSHSAKTAAFCYREGRRVAAHIAGELMGRLPDR